MFRILILFFITFSSYGTSFDYINTTDQIEEMGLSEYSVEMANTIEELLPFLADHGNSSLMFIKYDGETKVLSKLYEIKRIGYYSDKNDKESISIGVKHIAFEKHCKIGNSKSLIDNGLKYFIEYNYNDIIVTIRIDKITCLKRLNKI